MNGVERLFNCELSSPHTVVQTQGVELVDSVRIIELCDLCRTLIRLTFSISEQLSYMLSYIKKGKVFYGQEPPNGKSITTECGVNYQLLAVI